MSDFQMKTAAGRPDRDEEDEIEILEIVGLDEDSPAGRSEPSYDGEEGRDETSASELVVILDDDGQVGEDVADEDSLGGSERAVSGVAVDERLARITADFENLRKRVDRERLAHERYAAAGLVTRLLPVLDNFERALGTAREVGTDPGFCEGVAMIFRQLLEELRKEGLIAVDTVGEPFDPEVHEAVATTDDPTLPPHTIVEELQRGYLLHDRLLRPALVRVTVDPNEHTTSVEEG